MAIKFSITRKDGEMVLLVNKTDKKILAGWAIDCASRVLMYFEDDFPDDNRPRKALEVLKEWMQTGIFKMSVIRKASLDSHAAAREVGEDSPARSAARAAGQAVATAHVSTHSLGAALYTQQAISRLADATHESVSNERDWQLRQLLKLRKKGN